MIIGYHGQPEKGTFGNKRHFYQNRDRFTLITVRDDKHNWIPAHDFVVSGMTVMKVFTSIPAYLRAYVSKYLGVYATRYLHT